MLRRTVIGVQFIAAGATGTQSRLDCAARNPYVQRNILHCTTRSLMFKRISDWIARFFAPAFELIGELPPQALSRLTAPF